MVFKDYYKILGFNTSRINQSNLKIAYRDAAKKYHPDVNVGNRVAEEKFKDINEAYRVLSDNSAKRKYDRIWNTHVGRKNRGYEESKKSSDSLFSDFFNMFFGNVKTESKEELEDIKTKKKIPVKGENIETGINLSIEECYYGTNKKISLRTVEGKMKTFEVKIPAGIRDNEKIRLIRTRKSRNKWRKERRSIH